MKDIETLEAFVAAVDIAGDIAKRVTYVQTRTRWIREHLEHIKWLFVALIAYFVSTSFSPFGLPFLFNIGKIIVHNFIV